MLNHVLHTCPKYPFSNESMDKYQSEEVGDHDVANLRVHKYNPENIRLAIAEMIIIDEMSFRVVEGQGFIKVCKTFEPLFQVPSRIIVARDCMKLYMRRRRS